MYLSVYFYAKNLKTVFEAAVASLGLISALALSVRLKCSNLWRVETHFIRKLSENLVVIYYEL